MTEPPIRWWWLSFADEVPEGSPPGTGFLGGCFVPASSFARAVDAATLLGLNPGGEVRGWPMAPGITPEEHHRMRLFNMEELHASFGEMVPADEADAEIERRMRRARRASRN